MRINDVLTESQTEEGIASAVGSGIGAVSKAAGAIPGAVTGAWDKFKQGYQAGRSGVNGTGSPASNTPPVGGGSTTNNTTPVGGGSTTNNTTPVGGGSNRPYVAPASGGNTTTASSSAVDPKVIQTSIQHLSGSDVDRIRSMLKSRAGISESQLDELSMSGIAQGAKNLAGAAGSTVKGAYNLAKPVVQRAAQATGQAVKGAYNSAKPVVQRAAQATGQAIKAAPTTIGNAAGSVNNAVTAARGAYQQASGGAMTAQELNHAIATMSPDQANQMLQFFNTVHPDPLATSAPPVTPTPSVPESVGYSRYLGMHI